MNQILVTILLMIVITPYAFAQETIYLEANEFGRGIVKPKSSECFAIVPLHIVEESSNIKIIGEKNTKTKGELIQSTTNDLAIVRAFGGGQLYCADWAVDEQFDRILENATQGVLKIRQNDGGIKWLQVDIAEFNETNITIEPSRQNKTFSKGMSGSALFTDVAGEKVCLGMLMNIDSQNNEGYVLQLDNILSNLEDFFDLEKTKSTENKNGTQKSGVSSTELFSNKEDEATSIVNNSEFKNINTIDNFKFEIKEIKRLQEQIDIYFIVTNLDDEDRALKFIPHSNIFYDDKGDKIAQNSKACISKSCNSNGYRIDGHAWRHPGNVVGNLMPSGIPMNAMVSVRGVAKDATKFVRSDINVWINDILHLLQLWNLEFPN